MRPETAFRFAVILIPIGLVTGVVAVAIGNWAVAVAMVFMMVGQALNLRTSRRKLNRRGRPKP